MFISFVLLPSTIHFILYCFIFSFTGYSCQDESNKHWPTLTALSVWVFIAWFKWLKVYRTMCSNTRIMNLNVILCQPMTTNYKQSLTLAIHCRLFGIHSYCSDLQSCMRVCNNKTQLSSSAIESLLTVTFIHQITLT